MAPEVSECSGRRRIPYDAPKAVVWSLGVVLYAMLFAKFPENIRYRGTIYAKLASPESPINDDEKKHLLTESCHDILNKIFRERVGIREIKEHDFSQPLGKSVQL